MEPTSYYFNQDNTNSSLDDTPFPLPKEEYLQVIKHANIISVDMIVYDKTRRILLGKRKNEPAKNTYFTPGARVWKSETIPMALKRACKFELGVVLENPMLNGVYEHIYDNNFDNDDFGTHYLNFSYEFNIDDETKKSINEFVFSDQHSEIIWMTEEEILSCDDVHENCKAYFMENPVNKVKTN